MSKNVELTSKQLEEIKKVGWLILCTCGKDNKPHCTIIEPSKFSKDEIIIPIIQMVCSVKNLEENPNCFLHITIPNKSCFEDSAQYKIQGISKIERSGEMFEWAKYFEETERLPEGFTVNGIIRVRFDNITRTEG